MRRLRKSDPHPLQLAKLTKDEVLRLLQVVLGGRSLASGADVEARTSRWLWGLLARLPETGELTHSEIAIVRDLGRRAVLLGRPAEEIEMLRNGGDIDLDEGVSRGDAQDHGGEGEPGAGAPDEMESGESTEPVNPTPTESIAPATRQDGPDASHVEPPPETKDKTLQPNGHTMPDAGSDAMDMSESDAPAPQQDPGLEDGEIEDGEVEDGEVEDGEIADSEVEDGEVEDEQDKLLKAKSRLLEQLAAAEAETMDHEETKYHAKMNSRATIDMILTVVGEVYGQRDLLEFRDPFAALGE